MDETELLKLRDEYRRKIAEFVDSLRDDAISFLRKDGHKQGDQQISGVPADDVFMIRANQVGLALSEAGLYSHAGMLYDQLMVETDELSGQTGKTYHLGALIANRAIAHLAQGDIDRGVVMMLKAAQEDAEKRGGKPGDSYARTGLLEEHFSKRIRKKMLWLVRLIEPTIEVADLNSFCRRLGIRELVLLAYIEQARRHVDLRLWIHGNDFSHLQVFGALRSMACLFEVVLKDLGGSGRGLHKVMQSLYAKKPWWKKFEDTRKNRIEATQRSIRPVEVQLQDALDV